MPLTYKEHLIACLAEEAGEVVQMANKALRFYDFESNRVIVDNDRTDGKQGTALELLSTEINDLLGAIVLLEKLGIIPYHDPKAIRDKELKINKYWNLVVENSK